MKLPLPTTSPKHRAWYVFSGLWVLASIAMSVSVSGEIFDNDGTASVIFCFLVLSLATFLPIVHDWVAPQWSKRWIFTLLVVAFVASNYLLLVNGFFSSRHRRGLDVEFIISVFFAWSVAYFLSYWLTSNYEPSKKRQQEAVSSGTAENPLPADDRSTAPSVWKYIWAWVVASVTSGIAVSVLYWALATLLLTPSNFSSSIYWTIGPLAGGFVGLGIWILVYSFFSTLRISKVVPWMWGLMGLGYLSALGETSSIFDEVNRDMPATIILAFLAAYLLTVLGFSGYFRARQPARY